MNINHCKAHLRMKSEDVKRLLKNWNKSRMRLLLLMMTRELYLWSEYDIEIIKIDGLSV
jgi:6-phosphogluconate dehydrogenase